MQAYPRCRLIRRCPEICTFLLDFRDRVRWLGVGKEGSVVKHAVNCTVWCDITASISETIVVYY